MNSHPSYAARKRELIEKFRQNPPETLKAAKRSASNLFRYSWTRQNQKSTLSLKPFHHILGLDEEQKILDVEGAVPFEEIVRFTLKHGFLPQVAPELKHITISGAIVGIGIESSGFKYGFVHDSLVEAEVFLPTGEVVVATADNEYQDLFRALPNSYGTLGYILRAKIKLYPAKPYVKVTNTLFTNLQAYLSAFKEAIKLQKEDFLEGLFFNDQRYFLTRGELVEEPHTPCFDIYRGVYYQALARENALYLKTEDYIFRYDPEWFWNFPDTTFYQLFRACAPRSCRNSGFYKRYTQFKHRLLKKLPWPSKPKEEPLIQDWEIPWEHAEKFISEVMAQVDLQGLPWVALPITPKSSPSLYPVRKDELYFNLGCYCYIKTAGESFAATQNIDQLCFKWGGLKMLYSSSFMSEEQFDAIYGGEAYQRLKEKYDPEARCPSLFSKAVRNQ